MDFYVGMFLNINDECVGEVTQITSDKIYIVSEVFSGWAAKAEIAAAMATSAT